MKRMLETQNAVADKSGVKDLLNLLSEEIAAINNGNLDRVVELFDKKTSLLAKLETASTEIEAQLKLETKAAEDLRNNLRELSGLIHKDSRLLANMVEATQEIKTVIARIRKRHSLEGSYGVDGEKQSSSVLFSQQIDQSM